MLCIGFFVVFGISPFSYAKAKKKRSSSAAGSAFSAQAIIIVDVTKNRTLYSRNSHARYAPASTVKLLTALVALEQLGMKSQVRISRKAANTEPTKIWVSAGDSYRSGDLINAILVSSANDASVALAEAAAGSEREFAKRMNRRARKLGAKNSNFINASGLPGKGQYTTAYDLYRIAKAATANTTLNAILRKRKETIKSSRGKTTNLTNHNKLVFRRKYPVVLLKTGYTRSARHCYAGRIYLNGREYVFAFLKSGKPWTDIDKIISFIKRTRASK